MLKDAWRSAWCCLMLFGVLACGSNDTDPRQDDDAASGQKQQAAVGEACMMDGECAECEFCDLTGAAGAPNGVCENRNAGYSCGTQTVPTSCDQLDTCDGNGNCDPRYTNPGVACGTQTVATTCDALDQCDGAGNCDPNYASPGEPCGTQTVPTTCDQLDTCNGLGACDPRYAGLGVPCGDPADTTCTDPDTCNGSGQCLVNHEPNAIPCDDGNDCTNTDQCDPVSGSCVGLDSPATTPCEDGLFCTLSDECNGSGTCVGGPGVVCPVLEPQCQTPGACQEGVTQYFCDPPITNQGADCNDGVSCTQNDSCRASGACQGTPNPAICPQRQCGIERCDLVTGCFYDPEGQNTLCRGSAGVCDVAEFCDGSSFECPVDDFQPDTESCQAANCSSAVAQIELNCPGDGPACPVEPEVQCSPYVCAANGIDCRDDCNGDDDCLPQFYCDAGVCEPRVGVGDECTSDIQCSTGARFCIDGVCCNTACDGQCEACDVGGVEGTCTVVTGDPHGTRSPCEDDGTDCAGSCDGVDPAECSYPPTSTECAEAGCDRSANRAVEVSFCDGAGSCDQRTPVDCAPFVCGGDVCRGDCDQNGHCAMGSYCNAGMCVPEGDAGDSCGADVECASGFCTDGVCCESACNGQCEACNVEDSEGICLAVAGDPVGNRPACAAGDAACAGSCNGQNRVACGYPGADVVCEPAACEDGVATVEATCDGRGTCPALGTQECPEDVGCAGAICGGGCVVDGDCEAPTTVCRAGVCTAPEEDGEPCSRDALCESGRCVDGVCCESACSGQCEACDVRGLEGQCEPVPEGQAPHGARPRCTGDGSVCSGACDGSEREQCTYDVGTECREASCAEGAAVLQAVCVGNGMCPREQEQDCTIGGGDGSCAGDLCDGPCTTDPEACASGEYCSAGVCVEEKPEGDSCSSNAQCASSQCVDGVCCESACDGTCEACDLPGSLGSCDAVAGAPRGGRGACSGAGPCASVCDGTDGDACVFPDEDVSCGDASCSSGTRADAPSCDGSGRCGPAERTQCPAFSCSGTRCDDACSDDAECTPGYECNDDSCVRRALVPDKGTCGCRMPGSRRAPAPLGLFVLMALGSGALVGRRAVRGFSSNRAFGAH